MHRYLRSLACGSILVAASASSVFGSDDLGIYFDELGETVVVAAASNEVVHGYLILLNPSATTQLDFWSVAIYPNYFESIHGEEVWGEPRYGTNGFVPQPGGSAWSFQVTNEGLPPLLFEPLMVLADVYVSLGGEIGPIGLYLYNNAFYSTNGVIGPLDSSRILMYPTSGNWQLPVAMINGSAPVAVAAASWDEVKALYR